MHPGIKFRQVWFDNDVVELAIDSCDGKSLFSNRVYVGHQQLDDLIAGLNIFRNQVHGGLFKIEFGEFGPEYATGAFRALLHFQDRGRIHITLNAESEFEDFGRKNVASHVTLYLVSEPALLDNFIDQLKSLKAGHVDEARLDGVSC